MAKVVHLSTVHTTFDARIFHKECKTLRDAGHEVILYCHHPSSTIVDGIRIKSLGTPTSRPDRWKNIPSAARRAARENADVYHFHDPELIPAAMYLSKTTTGKVIFDVHENYPNKIERREWIPNVVKPILRRSFPFIQTAAAGRFDGLIGATEWVTDQFSHPMAVTVHNYPIADKIELPESPRHSEHEYQLAYVGSLNTNRGMVRMVKLTRDLVNKGLDVGLWLIGPIDGADAKRQADKIISKNNLENNITFFGEVNYVDIFEYLCGADAGLALTQPEDCVGAIPSKLFDYMYADLPIIASSMPMTNQYLPDNCGITVPFHDINCIGQDVEDLLRSGRHTELAGNGQEHIHEKFSWEQEQKTLLSLYNSLLSN
ncbi:glycosyltransferase [Haladaptatus sp. CMAA 1911]|uniref:glycosyltransferase n=1 Tax=unclassified Haladaptatus TaxID=2622732 RepID=UPI0037550197